MTKEMAEAVAAEALAWLAEDRERLILMLAQSGLGAEDVRDRAADPEFLGFVLDHLLAHEPVLLAFSRDAALAPEKIALARSSLPGGATPEWT